jgi:hypothetical protein
LAYRTQRADDLTMPGVHERPGGLDAGCRQRLASFGTHECGEQDEVDVEIMSVLQMQACPEHAVARIERQRKLLD